MGSCVCKKSKIKFKSKPAPQEVQQLLTKIPKASANPAKNPGVKNSGGGDHQKGGHTEKKK